MSDTVLGVGHVTAQDDRRVTNNTTQWTVRQDGLNCVLVKQRTKNKKQGFLGLIQLGFISQSC